MSKEDKVIKVEVMDLKELIEELKALKEEIKGLKEETTSAIFSVDKTLTWK